MACIMSACRLCMDCIELCSAALAIFQFDLAKIVMLVISRVRNQMQQKLYFKSNCHFMAVWTNPWFTHHHAGMGVSYAFPFTLNLRADNHFGKRKSHWSVNYGSRPVTSDFDYIRPTLIVRGTKPPSKCYFLFQSWALCWDRSIFYIGATYCCSIPKATDSQRFFLAVVLTTSIYNSRLFVLSILNDVKCK